MLPTASSSPANILQIGRSKFISSALLETNGAVSVFSSQSTPQLSLDDLNDGMIVFVPPKLPSPAYSARFTEWFNYTRTSVPKSVHVILISSMICASTNSLDKRYTEYRRAKQELEEKFKDTLLNRDPGRLSTILRLGMFMPDGLFTRARMIQTLAQMTRPFVSTKLEYRFTDHAALKHAFMIACRGRSSAVLEAVCVVRGLGLLQTPKLLVPITQKLYTTSES